MRIGIRREDKPFEKRVPLVPEDIAELKKTGIEVVVQPSNERAFSDEEFLKAGATIRESLDDCAVVFGIKEFPLGFLRRGGVYAFFSHTIKGQPHNMPLLARLLNLGCSLIDYEKVTDEHGRRLIFFGWHAGVAGMVETLWALARRLEEEGFKTPLLEIKRPLDYHDIAEMKAHLAEVGERLAKEGLPEAVVPLVVGIAGYGNVGRGAREILQILPHTTIQPQDLPKLFQQKPKNNTIYKVVFKEEHTVRPNDPNHTFNLQEFFEHPELYHGVFEQYLPYLTVLVNAIYWEQKYPRLMRKEATRKAYEAGKLRIKVVGDISCDINGAIEFTHKATTPGEPLFTWNPKTDTATDGCGTDGVVVMAVDILPAEFPRDSSTAFSRALMPFVEAMARADWTADFAKLNLPPEIKRAVILHKGELTPDFTYLKEHVKPYEGE